MEFNIEWENNPLVIHLPDGMGITKDDGDIFPVEKIAIVFAKIQEQVVFNVEVDGCLYIDENYKLVDDVSLAANFGVNPSGKNMYNSIFGRGMAVCTAICEGKIKLGKLT